jgi:MFS family permease
MPATTSDALATARDRIIYPAAVLMALCANMTALGLVFFLRDYQGATALQIGLAGALLQLGYGIACHVVRPRFGWLPASWCVVIAAGGIGVVSLGYTLAPGMGWIYALSVVQGVVLSLYWPVLMGWFSRGLEGEALNRRLGRFNLLWSSGVVVGPQLGGWLCGYDAALALYLAALLLSSLAGWALWVATRHPALMATRSGDEPAAATTGEADQSSPLRFPAWLGLLLTFMALGAVLTIFPVAADSEVGISRTTTGFLLLLRALFATIAFVVLGRIVCWHHRGWLMVGGLLLQGVLYVGLALTGQVWLLCGLFAALGWLHATSYVQSQFHGAVGAADRAARMAMHESLIGAGAVLGTVTGGWLFERGASLAVWGTMAGVMVLGALIQGVQLLRGRAAHCRS